MHTVAVLDNGAVYSWGVNDEGALGRQTEGPLWEKAEVRRRDQGYGRTRVGTFALFLQATADVSWSHTSRGSPGRCGIAVMVGSHSRTHAPQSARQHRWCRQQLSALSSGRAGTP